MWGTLLSCLPILALSCSGVVLSCGFPGSPAHSSVTFSTASVQAGTEAAYSCEHGFEMLGPARKQCQQNGTWTPDGIPFCVINVAAGKAPMQSSTAQGGIPQKAVDGSTSTFYDTQTCTLTEQETAPLWYVNLLEPYMVQLVRLDFGRSCCDNGEPATVVVRVGNNRPDLKINPICNRFTGFLEEGRPLFLPCSPPMPGAFVSVHLEAPSGQMLSICEAFVYTDQALPIERCRRFRDQRPGSTATYNGKCYTFYSQQALSFADAQNTCKQRGGSLIAETNPALQGFLSWELWRRHRDDPSGQYWMGAVRDPDDAASWKWISGEAVGVSFWSLPGGSDNCARFDGTKDWLWSDTDCQQQMHFICQHQPLACGRPEQPANASLEAVDFGVGAQVRYRCAEGHLLVGPEQRTCLETGYYSGYAPTCNRMECGAPAAVAGGQFELLNGTSGYRSVVEYRCQRNHVLLGRRRLMCDIDQRWNGPPPRCQPVKCAEPGQVENAIYRLSTNSTIVGTVVEYFCVDDQFVMQGPSTIRCLSNGSYDAQPPICIDFASIGFHNQKESDTNHHQSRNQTVSPAISRIDPPSGSQYTGHASVENKASASSVISRFVPTRQQVRPIIRTRVDPSQTGSSSIGAESGNSGSELDESTGEDELTGVASGSDLNLREGERTGSADQRPSMDLRVGDKVGYGESEKTRPARLMVLRRRKIDSDHRDNTHTASNNIEIVPDMENISDQTVNNGLKLTDDSNRWNGRKKLLTTSSNIDEDEKKPTTSRSENLSGVAPKFKLRRRPNSGSSLFRLKLRNSDRNLINSSSLGDVPRSKLSESVDESSAEKSVIFRNEENPGSDDGNRRNYLSTRRRRIRLRTNTKKTARIPSNTSSEHNIHDAPMDLSNTDKETTETVNKNNSVLTLNLTESVLLGELGSTRVPLPNNERSETNDSRVTQQHNERTEDNYEAKTTNDIIDRLADSTDLDLLSVTSLFTDITKSYRPHSTFLFSDTSKNPSPSSTLPPSVTPPDSRTTTVFHNNSSATTAAGVQPSDDAEVPDPTISYERPERNEVPDTVNIRQNYPPGINIPQNTLDERVRGSHFNIGIIIALGVFGGFVFLAATITSIIIIAKRNSDPGYIMSRSRLPASALRGAARAGEMREAVTGSSGYSTDTETRHGLNKHYRRAWHNLHETGAGATAGAAAEDENLSGTGEDGGAGGGGDNGARAGRHSHRRHHHHHHHHRRRSHQRSADSRR